MEPPHAQAPVAADSAAAHADELFRSRLENQIDLRHPLAKLARRMPWADLEDALTPILPPDPADGGRPALPVRLMAGLLYLKHAYDPSDEESAHVGWRTRTGSSSPARWCSRRRCRATPVR